MSRIRKSGGYRQLASFQTATIIYDATVWFCEKFIDSRSRTVDQMVQAARSGRQNIAEGSRAAATSSQTELRLVNVARASLEELLLDYEDYLRHRRLPLWPPSGPEASAVRSVASAFKRLNQTDRSDRTDRADPRDQTDQSNLTDRTDLVNLTDHQRWALYSRWLDHEDPAIRANAIICLIHQANYLLDQQIDALEKQFIDDGGYSEQLATARLRKRHESQIKPQSQSSNPSQNTNQHDPTTSAATNAMMTTPTCPICGKLMALRTAKSGPNTGRQFWGCTAYPDCKGVAKL